MFLNLNHENLEVYQVARNLVKEVYQITLNFPESEKFLLCNQLRRAAISVKLNLAEGFSRTSAAERKRFFEVSRGSLIEVNSALEIAIDLKYISIETLKEYGILTIRCFKLISGLITKLKQE